MENSCAEVALIISNVDKVAGLERAKLYKIESLVRKSMLHDNMCY